MKHIDMDSKIVNTVRNTAYVAGGIGGIVVSSSVLDPFVRLMPGGRIKQMFAKIGSFMLSIGAGYFAGDMAADAVDTAVVGYNLFADRFNGNHDIPDEPEAEVSMSGVDYSNYDISFWGDDAEDKAKEMFESLTGILANPEYNGVVTLNDFRATRGLSGIEDGDVSGWNANDIYSAEIVPMQLIDENGDFGYLLRLPRPHDISDNYITIPETIPSDNVEEFMETMSDESKELIENSEKLREKVAEDFENAQETIQEAKETIHDSVEEAREFIGDAFEEAKNSIDDIIEKIANGEYDSKEE